MNQHYIISENAVKKSYFRQSTSKALSLLMFGAAVSFFNAQNARVSEDPAALAKMSYNDQINNGGLQTNGTSFSTVKKAVALAGTYNVGTGGDYATLTAAVADFNSAAITGPVVFNLTDATYTAETFPITINENAGSSATNTLTIKPAAGAEVMISGNVANLFKINAADYVTFNGSNNGTNSKNLTLNSTATTGTNTIVWVASTSTAGADYATFKNIKFLGQTPTATVAHIIASGPTLGSAGTVANNYLMVDGNDFKKAQNAVFSLGPSATVQDDGVVIRNNTIGSATLTEGMGFRGLGVQNSKNVVISKNKIEGVSVSSTATSSGILVGGALTNVMVSENMINEVSNTNATGYGSNGIYCNAGTGATNVTLANNFVSNVHSIGYNLGGLADNGNGIVLGGVGSGIKVYYNTISLKTNQNVTGRPSAINVLSTVTTAGALDIRNNIFANTQTQVGEKYAIYSGAANTVFANIDHNDYYSSGANLGFIGSVRTDLAAIQAGFGQNTNSLNVAPVFVSDTDLHLTSVNTGLDKKGTPVAVTIDIDGEARDAATPDVGADEFTAVMAVDNSGKTQMRAYPNPVVDFVTLQNSTKIESVDVYNVTGQKVASKSLNSTTGQLDMRNVAPGMYIITVKAGGNVQTVKVVKK